MIQTNADLPTVLIHILAKDKAKILPYWLEQNLDNLDYPRDKVFLYFRTNNNNDDTASILHQWIDDQPVRAANGYESDEHLYNWRDISIEDTDLDLPLQDYGVHEWNPTRFKALAQLRQEGINEAIHLGADFYYTCDVDNFVLPKTLKSLVKHNQPVVAPLIRYALGKQEHESYANYHNIATPNGYFQDNPAYYQILNGHVRGLIQCDVVHCTYLIRKDVLPKVSYSDSTDDYEYVIFSRRLREQAIPQYLDNTSLYGFLTLDEDVTACQSAMAKLR
jgi:hypothetical protein